MTFTKTGSEVGEGRGFVYFGVTAGASNDKVENAERNSATVDGKRALLRKV